MGEMNVFDIGKFGEVAKILVQKIAGAGWLIYEPVHVKRMAAADVAADRIRQLGQIENVVLGEGRDRSFAK